FRAQKKMTSREEVLVDVAHRLDDYNALEKSLTDTVPFGFAAVRKAMSKMKAGRERAQAAAHAARKEAGIDGALIADICSVLENRGVKVLTPSYASEGFFGLSVADGDGGPAVVVNTWERISVERWIFTAAHELGHLLMHLNAFDVAQDEEDKTQEVEADVFAAHFLMPEELFEEEYKDTWGLGFVDRVLKLKRIFRVSYRTVLYRMQEKLPPADRSKVWMRFAVEYKRHTRKSLGKADEPEALPPEAFNGRPPDRSAEEPDRLLAVDFMGDRLSNLVRRSVEQEVISLGRAAEILGIELKKMRVLANSWVTDA
ncbi:MAG: ImmA/IrrE family metallo-endopeptidase, partial [Polyangiaceae bacterium]